MAGRVWRKGFHSAGNEIAGNTIEFIIAYTEGPFRDRLICNASNGKWRFAIESAQGPEQWKHFAAYEIGRAKQAP
jgi:hypothetical protein